MGYFRGNRIKETTTTTGTGSYSLGGAQEGFQSFEGAGIADGDVVTYEVDDGSDWEISTGVWSTGGTLSRDTVLSSSNGGTAVDWSTGDKTIILTPVAENATDLPVAKFPTITGLAIRFSARFSAMDLVDGRIQKIYDLSGNDNHSTTEDTAAYRPALYSRRFNGAFPGIFFNGIVTSPMHLVVPFTQDLTQPFTAVFVMQGFTGGQASYDLYKSASGGASSYRSSVTKWAMYDGTVAAVNDIGEANVNNSLGGDAAPIVRIDVFDGSSSVMSGNGVEATTNPGTSSGGITTPVYIGCKTDLTAAARFLMYECLFFDKALDSDERAELNSYYSTIAEFPLV